MRIMQETRDKCSEATKRQSYLLFLHLINSHPEVRDALYSCTLNWILSATCKVIICFSSTE